ncbi:MAG: hypothetical protein LBH63_00100, partial [Clostridiales Family XIII bacterium]|nr:hypothetical protein [Clostridiales Family XIII bacterium]
IGLIEKDELVEFARCLDEDFARLGFDELRGDKPDLLSFLIEYRIGKSAIDENGNNLPRANQEEEKTQNSSVNSHSFLNYSITSDFERSVEWLKKHGYYDKMIEASEKIKEMQGDETHYFG